MLKKEVFVWLTVTSRLKTRSDQALAKGKGIIGVHTKSWYSFLCKSFRLLRSEFGFTLGG